MSSEEAKKQLIAQKLMRNLKMKQKQTTQLDTSKETVDRKRKKESDERNKGNESDLTRRAIEEIQKDTLRASKLADEIGPSGWRMKAKRMNKRFLSNTMNSVLSHNERTKQKHATDSKRKLDELTKRPPKFGARMHSFQMSEERMTKRKRSDSKT